MGNKLLKIYKSKITVCLYYSDYKNKKLAELYKKKGFIINRFRNNIILY